MNNTLAISKRAAVFLATLSLVAGCGGGGGSNTNPTDPTGLTAEGIAIINSMLSDASPITTARLRTAEGKFAQARSLDSSHRSANGGLAITRSALAVQQVLDTFGVTITRGEAPPDPLLKAVGKGHLGAIGNLAWNTSIADVLPQNLLSFAGETSLGTREYPHSPTHTQVLAAVKDSLGLLASASDILESAPLPTDSQPLTIVDPTGNSPTVKLGSVEFQALRSSVQLVRAALELALAYDTDLTAYLTESATMGQKLSQWGLSEGGLLIPSQYLPSGFGDLNPDGLNRTRAFWINLDKAARSAKSAIASYESRDGATGFAVPSGYASSPELADAKVALDEFLEAISGPYHVTGRVLPEWWDENQEPIPFEGFVTLKAWTDNPPTSLRSFVPNVQVVSLSPGAAWLFEPQGTSIDRTLGGLFSVPVPIEVFSDEVVYDASPYHSLFRYVLPLRSIELDNPLSVR